MEPSFLKLIGKKNEMLERGPINRAVRKKTLAAYKHEGFWFCMDTIRDKLSLENMLKKRKLLGYKMKIVILGGSGYLASCLCYYLKNDNKVILVSRSNKKINFNYKNVEIKKGNYFHQNH